MSNYLIQGETLTNIADEIRIMTDVTEGMLPSDMINNLESVNAEIDNQASLISEVMAALEGKAAAAPAEVEIKTATKKLSSNATSISFTGLSKEPKMFAISPTAQITLGTTRYVTSVMYDSSTTHGTYGYRSGSTAYSYYSASYFTWTYSNGTLTVKTNSSTNGGNFTSSVTYQLAYVEEIPSSGGSTGGSSGVTVQRKAGSFTTTRRNNGEYADATVNCGFSPDVVVVKGKVYNYNDDEQYYYDMIAVFPERDSNRNYNVISTDDTYNNIECEISQTDDGFYFDMWAYDWDWNEVSVSSRSYDYVAIKYT